MAVTGPSILKWINQSSSISEWQQLIDSVPIWRSQWLPCYLKEGILKWELYCSSISGDNFDWFSTNMEVKWLPCYPFWKKGYWNEINLLFVTRDRQQLSSHFNIPSFRLTWQSLDLHIGTESIKVVTRDRRTIELSFQLLIDSVPIWQSSDCHVIWKKGYWKWELYCSSISGDNFDLHDSVLNQSKLSPETRPC